MKIEISCEKGKSNKEKGDLLENLAKTILEAQSYIVTEQVRVVGAELDLLCTHKVNGKTIYVECKAQKDPIAAPVLRQLWGTVDSEDFSEGWLISTSSFSKDAKGFVSKWKLNSKEKSSRLSFYSPEMVISSLKDAKIISEQPSSKAAEIIGGCENLGEWTLLVSTYGIYWCVYTLKGGQPDGILVFKAYSGELIQDKLTLSNLSCLESTLTNYNLFIALEKSEPRKVQENHALPVIVEVETGDSWNDYRPARPQDFVGRDATQKDILNFIDSAKNSSGSHVFAITGNSGLGKSSLIAKLRDRSRNNYYKNKYFVFAVDIRGARSPSYILSSLLVCLKKAQAEGFGKEVELNLTDPSTPLTSPSIVEYFNSLKEKNQVICLIFDQFEELYSKPELFGIFRAAKDLMLDVAGSKQNFVLGFAWKTDSTTQQDHPAYHMWHELSDHRREYKLDVFDTGEIANSITQFEKEIGQKITAQSRHQITHSSQGFPWLLKKLCINLYEGISKGEGSESILVGLDAKRLFEGDLESLSQSENSCLKLVAQKAPADWSEIIEISGTVPLNNLINKRLVIKSGDRLNIYWDILKDYLLTGRVPVIPFNYIPTTDLTSMLNVCEKLEGNEFIDANKLAIIMSLNEKTIWNIGADLVMFDLAEREGTSLKLHRDMAEYSEEKALELLRSKLDKHSLKIALYKKLAGKPISNEQIKTMLIACLPKEKFGEKTWTTYTNKLKKLLICSGFLSQTGNNLIVHDFGKPIQGRPKLARTGRQGGDVFSISVSPKSVFDTIEDIKQGKTDISNLSRNALTVLKRFDLISIDNGTAILNEVVLNKYNGSLEAIWSMCKKEASLIRCVELKHQKPSVSNKELAQEINNEYKLDWSDGSIKRNGGILSQWSNWLLDGLISKKVPVPPGRINEEKEAYKETELFDLDMDQFEK